MVGIPAGCQSGAAGVAAAAAAAAAATAWRADRGWGSALDRLEYACRHYTGRRPLERQSCSGPAHTMHKLHVSYPQTKCQSLQNPA